MVRIKIIFFAVLAVLGWAACLSHWPVTGQAGLASAEISRALEPGIDPACLVGDWEAPDARLALAESYEQSQASLALESVDGRLIYSLTADGEMTVTYDHLSAVLSGAIDYRPVTVKQALDGTAAALYQVNARSQEMVLSDFGGEGVTFSLQINRQTLVEGSLPVWRSFISAMHGSGNTQPTPLVRYARLAVTCAGDEMTLRALDPLEGPTIELRRLTGG